jgi:hypothetical protein
MPMDRRRFIAMVSGAEGAMAAARQARAASAAPAPTAPSLDATHFGLPPDAARRHCRHGAFQGGHRGFGEVRRRALCEYHAHGKPRAIEPSSPKSPIISIAAPT